jgi:hypothetical protein
MKRRAILGTIGIAVVPQTAGATLYGTPVSVTGPAQAAADVLRLPLSGADIPPSTMDDINRYRRLWSTVFTDAATRADFRRDPGIYLRRQGLPATVLTTDDHEVRLMQALADDEILATSMSGDYAAFMGRLKELGLVQRGPPSNLKRRVVEAMRQNLPEIQSSARALAEQNDDAYLQDLLQSQELRYLYTQLTPSIEQVAVVAVPVAIAAIVVTYISVAVGVTVAITAGVYISIAVSMGVVASAGCFNTLDQAFQVASAENGPLTATTSGTSHRREVDRAMATRILIGKRLLALAPEQLREAQVISRTARLLNNDAFVLEANRQLVRDEIGAFVEAAEEVGLISIAQDTRPAVIKAMEQLALRAAALD